MRILLIEGSEVKWVKDIMHLPTFFSHSPYLSCSWALTLSAQTTQLHGVTYTTTKEAVAILLAVKPPLARR